jgi:ribosomal protein S24E
MMDINIVETVEVPEFPRKEIKATITYEGATPKENDIKTAIAGALKVSSEVVLLKKIETNFGERSGKVYAHIYTSKENIDYFAPAVGRKALEKAGKLAAKTEAAPADK